MTPDIWHHIFKWSSCACICFYMPPSRSIATSLIPDITDTWQRGFDVTKAWRQTNDKIVVHDAACNLHIPLNKCMTSDTWYHGLRHRFRRLRFYKVRQMTSRTLSVFSSRRTSLFDDNHVKSWRHDRISCTLNPASPENYYFIWFHWLHLYSHHGEERVGVQ